ncbi:hypothetical protein H2200_002993 [Cladophialophora chaetospira]|uniref:Amino acid transporter n=1 Tax=Cladophialophora chaetospira TaxID=386627 RepID=A0AA38XGL0_9EURO|nr:hypothetical protein H2200_002993 [Cladophialophora chaetospira]
MEFAKDQSTVFASDAGRDLAYLEHDEEDDDNIDPSVPVQYRGTGTDKREMKVLGKTQVLRRNFKFVAMLGFASTVMASWEILLPLFTFVLIDGGTALLFWGLIVCILGMTCVYASIAEMASMSPTAGGQYHWVSEFAPRRIQKFLSYLVGWLCTIGWQAYLGGITFMAGSVIQGLIELNVEGYVWHAYHGTLLTIMIIVFSIAFNTVFASKLPLIEAMVLFLHFCGLFAIIIPLWVLGPRSPAHETLLDFSNNGGWSSTGLSAMIGLTTPLSVIVGYDCSVHMSEEIHNASLTLPRAIMGSIVVNGILAFIMAVTLIFTLGDIDSILNSPTREPFIQQIYNATGSLGGTNAMVAVVIILLTASATSEVATASRQIWSFARDRGVPGSYWIAKVTPGWNIPLQAVSVSLVISSLLACINLGSTAALNAINSCGSVSILTSYIITIGCLLAKRLRGEPLPPRRWSLGKYGIYLNVISVLFLLPLWFFSFWPLGTPVTPESMNWSLTIFGGVLILAMIYYVLRARHNYTGPVVQVKRE